MIPSRDTIATTCFFEGLGFSPKHFDSGYAICEKDGLTVHIQPMGEGVGEMSIYLEVDDVDGLFASAAPVLTGNRVKPPFDQPYGMREFHADIPHTNCLLFVGQSLPSH